MKKALPVLLQISTFSLLLASLMFSAIGVRPAHAATTWTVTSTGDDATNTTGACPGVCPLRKALSLAAPGDTVVFDAALSGQMIYLADTLTLSQDVIIDGSSLSTQITISGDSDNNAVGDVRIFTIDSGVTVTLDSLTLTKGQSPAFGGGAILNNGTLAIDASYITNSTAIGNGGGAILNWGGTVTIHDSALGSNSASSGGGIVNYTGGTLTMTQSTLYGNNTTGSSSGAGITNFGTLTFTNGVFMNNTSASGGGGAIYNSNGTATITNSLFSSNSANVGGAIYNIQTLNVTGSTFTGNSSTFAGGAINTSSVANIKDSFFNSNSAATKGGAISSNSPNTTITNSSFYQNSAVTVGGGVYSWVSGIVIKSSTFSYNSAPPGKGGGIYNDGPMELTNTIIAYSLSGGDCKNGSGNTSVNVNNLIEDGSCGTTRGGDPKLGAPANNGGPTQTMALMGGSPAVDAGNDAACAASPVNNLDQRGIARPVGGHCDIGAFESRFTSVTYTSNGAQDGWVLESSETSNQGQTINSNNSVFFMGDDKVGKQYRGILSFTTSGLPDTAVIASALLKMKQHGLVGSNPGLITSGFAVDVKTGSFGAVTLQPVDFQTAATATYNFPWTPANNSWFTFNLTNAKNIVNKLTSGGGLTQVRVRFKLDDSNNNTADYMSFFSGDAAAASRPQLIIQYYVP